MMRATLGLALSVALLAPHARCEDVVIGGVKYEKLATRVETERRMLDLLTPS